MPYSIYSRESTDKGLRFTWEDSISLAGCNSGLIARALRKILIAEHKYPVGWSLPISDKYNDEKRALLVDLKPNSSDVLICELDRVFGFCYESWTPIMLRLRILIEDQSASEIDKGDFYSDLPNGSGYIYTMLYLTGSIANGQLTGKWSFPGPSSTNALLFWPEAISFFFSQVKKYDPDFLLEEVTVINA